MDGESLPYPEKLAIRSCPVGPEGQTCGDLPRKVQPRPLPLRVSSQSRNRAPPHQASLAHN